MNKQSNNNTQFPSGAQRDDRQGKLRFSLLPHKEIDRVMKRFLDGAETYGENNWKKGAPLSIFYDSAMRHVTQWWKKDESEDHLAAAAWNILAAMYIENNLPDMDDRNEFP